MTKIAVLVSGSGTNLQALINAQKEDRLNGGEISLVISSKQSVFALERAVNAGIKTVIIERKNYPNILKFDIAICTALCENDIDLVVLAGFLSVLGEKTLSAFKNRIINVHPALLPSFGGKGFYGLHVHRAVLERGVKVTGATVHFVNEEIDGGKIILQKALNVLADDSPESLQRRVMETCEWEILPKAVAMFCGGEL